MKPKLRSIQTHLIQHQGQPAVLLRDPLRISPNSLAVPQRLAPVLGLCDGSRDPSAIRAALEVRTGLRLAPGVLEQLLTQLDEALLLDNRRFTDAYAEALRIYRRAPHRPLMLAGEVYPANLAELRRQLQGYAEAAGEQPTTTTAGTDQVRGLVSPHIDYQRGGPVYAQVWSRASRAVQQAELAVIFGTDHMGGEGRLTLTRQSYATPWGVLPTDGDVVDVMSQTIGPEAAFGEELHHRGEHSIELAAVWLHYVRNGQPCRVVPILCGSFAHFVEGRADPQQALSFSATIAVLREVMAARRTIVIAAADLAHVGPAFGDPIPFDLLGRARVRVADGELLSAIIRGDATGFFQAVKAHQDRWRVCGLPPIYLALRLLGGAQGEVTGYAQCPADAQATSLVSVCGAILTRGL